MNISLPNVNEILNEFTNEANTSIKNNDKDSFDKALYNLIEIHGFVINAYNDNKPKERISEFNYSQVAESFSSENELYIRNYYTLLETATDVLLSSNNHYFLSECAKIPSKLLNVISEKTPSGVIIDTFRLSSYQLYLINKSIIKEKKTKTFDVDEFNKTIARSIGSYEDITGKLPYFRRWKEIKGNNELIWDTYKHDYNVFNSHIFALAEMVLTSIWYENEETSKAVIDSLLKWNLSFAHVFDNVNLHRNISICKPFLLKLTWSEAKSWLKPHLNDYEEDCLSPSDVMSSILNNLWNDVIVMVSGMILYWYEKDSTKSYYLLSLRDIINGKTYYEDHLADRGGLDILKDSENIIFSLIRLVSLNKKDNYSDLFDRFLLLSDSVSDTLHVGSRSYSPKTINSHSEIIVYILLILAASTKRYLKIHRWELIEVKESFNNIGNYEVVSNLHNHLLNMQKKSSNLHPLYRSLSSKDKNFSDLFNGMFFVKSNKINNFFSSYSNLTINAKEKILRKYSNIQDCYKLLESEASKFIQDNFEKYSLPDFIKYITYNGCISNNYSELEIDFHTIEKYELLKMSHLTDEKVEDYILERVANNFYTNIISIAINNSNILAVDEEKLCNDILSSDFTFYRSSSLFNMIVSHRTSHLLKVKMNNNNLYPIDDNEIKKPHEGMVSFKKSLDCERYLFSINNIDFYHDKRFSVGSFIYKKDNSNYIDVKTNNGLPVSVKVTPKVKCNECLVKFKYVLGVNIDTKPTWYQHN